ncbi:antibiotic biosynthesis monooxygenase [Sulfitobacter sp. D35]|uniref:antibiotic biosynthesis monooxygenase family protein n=1 Tax=Sulfitobacter sp. D35 TaxID=3083252 RepID=UPI00296FE17D|nr:antibiotic biosynthesis monooxygenase [Sulfitobacter sp. D35]MDW4498014.1 antibiotic biosynthesis monooxygenase [Sulfitobacter sp. D35]
MIMRIFQVTARPGKEADFARFFHETAIPLMKRTEGLRTILPGAARADAPRDFAFVMVWESLAALKRFVGEDISSPHVDPAEAELAESRSIRHYDLVEA